jgi:hypothetical protein
MQVVVMAKKVTKHFLDHNFAFFPKSCCIWGIGKGHLTLESCSGLVADLDG